MSPINIINVHARHDTPHVKCRDVNCTNTDVNLVIIQSFYFDLNIFFACSRHMHEYIMLDEGHQRFIAGRITYPLSPLCHDQDNYIIIRPIQDVFTRCKHCGESTESGSVLIYFNGGQFSTLRFSCSRYQCVEYCIENLQQ